MTQGKVRITMLSMLPHWNKRKMVLVYLKKGLNHQQVTPGTRDFLLPGTDVHSRENGASKNADLVP